MSNRRVAFKVESEVVYSEEQSDIAGDNYVFLYHIKISNTGDVPAQLISRHWVITDANGQVHEVRGMGVVGEQPHIAPGECFEYSSGATLNTPYGTMSGRYQLVCEQGERHEAAIPEMQLVAVRILH